MPTSFIISPYKIVICTDIKQQVKGQENASYAGAVQLSTVFFFSCPLSKYFATKNTHLNVGL